MPTNTRGDWRTVEGQIKKRNAIHPQGQSPLFGKCCPEIRNSIFRWVLMAEEDPDTTLYESDGHAPRPGDSRCRRIHTALLLTCSAVYLETHRVVVNINEHVFWLGCASPSLPIELCRTQNGPPLFCGTPKSTYRYDIKAYFNNVLTKQQGLDATSIHLHVTKDFFEDSLTYRSDFEGVSKLLVMKRVKHLRISIGVSAWELDYPSRFRVIDIFHLCRRIFDRLNFLYANSRSAVGDQSPLNSDEAAGTVHGNQTSTSLPAAPKPPVVELPLAMDLRIAGKVDIDKMQALIQQNEHVPIEKGSFASHLLKLVSLETLTLEFDTLTSSRHTLETLVDHARSWVFPRKPKGRGKAKVDEEMKVLDATETTEWKPFNERQNRRWAVLALPYCRELSSDVDHMLRIADEATTMKLKWVVVRKTP